jgi:hypothetical protein
MARSEGMVPHAEKKNQYYRGSKCRLCNYPFHRKKVQKSSGEISNNNAEVLTGGFSYRGIVQCTSDSSQALLH